MPVAGTISRGEEMPFLVPKDAQGDTTNYVASKQVVNPLPALDSSNMKEAERLFLVNCGICHGVALNGNGPLYKDGNGPFPAKPANFVGDPKIYGNAGRTNVLFSHLRQKFNGQLCFAIKPQTTLDDHSLY